ncbi:hypothetical protein BC828DRAFT_377348 [Blastocladiella britannica]|nr:hypothetical protein BC828DRAFT_377348 [Blastocladiella britannica]
MSLTVIDYIEGYHLYCTRKSVLPIPSLDKLLAVCIDDGHTPTTFTLRGNHPELRDRRISDDYLDVLILPFAGNDFLTTLDLSFNHITDRGGSILAKWLRSTQKLQYLILASNMLGSAAGIALSESLTVNVTLRSIDLSHNALGHDGGMALAGMLQVNTSLTCLRIHHCGLTLSALIALCTVLHNNNTLSSLDIGDNDGGGQQRAPSLHTDFVRHLAHMLAMNRGLKELGLAKLNISDEDAREHLGPAFELARGLQELDLTGNHLKEDAAHALTCHLVAHPSLTSLRLSNNSLGTRGVLSLASLLKNNVTLARLYLDHVRAGADAMLALAQVLLRINSTLSTVAVWGNDFYSGAPQGMHQAEDCVEGEGVGPGSACAMWGQLIEPRRQRLQLNQVDIVPYEVQQEWAVARNERFVG